MPRRSRAGRPRLRRSGSPNRLRAGPAADRRSLARLSLAPRLPQRVARRKLVPRGAHSHRRPVRRGGRVRMPLAAAIGLRRRAVLRAAREPSLRAPAANPALRTPRATRVRRLRGRHDPTRPPADRPAVSTGGRRNGRPSRVVALSGRPTKTGRPHGSRRVRPGRPLRGQRVRARIRVTPERLASSGGFAVPCRLTRRFPMTYRLPIFLERRGRSSVRSPRRPPTWSPAIS